ncbi:MAG TPA: hypothetical protein VEK33_24245 [Terriglobales bacterium]|nr:hypothetical protein [Terriglobales bacterium]
MPISAIDAISPAFEHTKRQLFQPFRAEQWAKLALVGLLAGELTTGSCGNNNFRIPKHPNEVTAGGLSRIDPALLVLLMALLIVLGFVFFTALLYLNSVMRFVLFDSVVARRCDLREQWNQRQGAALRYFMWQVLFSLAVALGLALLIAVPATFALAAGWLTKPKEHMPVLILAGMVLFLAVSAFVVVSAIVQVFTKDFVIPQMALEDLSAFEGWRRLWPMLWAEKGSYFGYLLLKMVMAIGVGIILGIIATVAILVAIVPLGGFGALAVLGGKALGLEWNAYTVTLAVVAGSIVLAMFCYFIALIGVPTVVFFPAYSIYFLASRYPGLAMALHPAAPIPSPPRAAVPPPISPLPEASS